MLDNRPRGQYVVFSSFTSTPLLYPYIPQRKREFTHNKNRTCLKRAYQAPGEVASRRFFDKSHRMTPFNFLRHRPRDRTEFTSNRFVVSHGNRLNGLRECAQHHSLHWFQKCINARLACIFLPFTSEPLLQSSCLAA